MPLRTALALTLVAGAADARARIVVTATDAAGNSARQTVRVRIRR